jgi:NAD(P)-dependent dehydrogenase (short-subunit alcohol dehydrogenase family)
MLSKNALNALTTAQQNQFDMSQRQDITVSAVHPGEVLTDMNPDFGNIEADQGADTIIYLALLDNNTTLPKGKFWYERQPVEWSDPNLNLSIFH